jgi:hypothetical protein
LHIDFGWWGFVVSIVTILLAVPLSMLANLLTPKVQSWWALTSKKRLARRIRWIKYEIENPPTFVQAVSYLVLLIPGLFIGVLMGIAFVINMIMRMNMFPGKPMTHSDNLLAHVMIYIIEFGAAFTLFVMTRFFVEFIRVGHRKVRGYEENYVQDKKRQLDKLLKKGVALKYFDLT